MSFQVDIFGLATKDWDTFILMVQIYSCKPILCLKIMHQNLAVILRQFNYSKISFIVLVPGVKREDGATTLDDFHK